MVEMFFRTSRKSSILRRMPRAVSSIVVVVVEDDDVGKLFPSFRLPSVLRVDPGVVVIDSRSPSRIIFAARLRFFLEVAAARVGGVVVNGVVVDERVLLAATRVKISIFFRFFSSVLAAVVTFTFFPFVPF